MTPYYADDLVTLYHGDCLEVTEWLSADVLVTDPPYGIGWSIGKRRGIHVSRPHAGIANDQDTAARDQALSIWGDSRPSVVFGSWDAWFPAHKQVLVWRKPPDAGVVGSTTGYRRDTELIFLCGPWPQRPASRSSVFVTDAGTRSYIPLDRGQGHPHMKPVGLLSSLLEWTDGAVADPFAGSGSTLVAAKALGRRAIGVELEERYCEIAAKRLAQSAFDFSEVPA